MGSDGHAYQVTDREEMLRFVPTDARAVLDVGCSRGGFGRLLRSAVPHARLLLSKHPAPPTPEPPSPFALAQ